MGPALGSWAFGLSGRRTETVRIRKDLKRSEDFPHDSLLTEAFHGASRLPGAESRQQGLSLDSSSETVKSSLPSVSA